MLKQRWFGFAWHQRNSSVAMLALPCLLCQPRNGKNFKWEEESSDREESGVMKGARSSLPKNAGERSNTATRATAYFVLGPCHFFSAWQPWLAFKVNEVRLSRSCFHTKYPPAAGR
ncbi:hypothetical protein NPIL_408151 [Nephila pilipes]|uniref:Uncharacterized protein n=1 Tax=Nephila pilipes TaxID=299642 RepID=A0A8X6QNT2_NEPPI|nr:hypothetical protein NPIL_408151 [Nephila pilipes]